MRPTMATDQLLEQRLHPRSLITHVTMVAIDDVRREIQEGGIGPLLVVWRIAVDVQSAEQFHRLGDWYLRFRAGFLKREPSAAAIVDSKVFEYSHTRGIVDRDLSDCLVFVECHALAS